MIQSVPVGMFHHVNENAGDSLTVSVDNFKNMMEMLHKENYTTLSSEEFFQYKTGTLRVPPKSVLLTFDDGWLDVFVHAFPIMKFYGHKFTVFVVSDRTEAAEKNRRKGIPDSFPLHGEASRLVNSGCPEEVVCNWDDLRAMLDSGLCSLENHTASHGQGRDVRADIERGRAAMQARLGIAANQLCWPRGKHDGHSMEVARELGIEMTYLVRRGINVPRLWTMKIKRFTVDDQSAEWFKKQLDIFSSPIYGYIYSRIKPDRSRLFKKLNLMQ